MRTVGFGQVSDKPMGKKYIENVHTWWNPHVKMRVGSGERGYTCGESR